MIISVNLPDIGEGVVEGEVIEWLKQPGDSLAQDEPVVIVMTDKATVELPAPYPGILAKHYFAVGEIAIRDKPLYDIEIAKDTVKIKPEIPEKKPQGHPQHLSLDIPITKTETHPLTPCEKRAQAAPATRKLAKELGIPIDSISGSGPEGRVTKEDVINSTQEKLRPTFSTVPRLPGDQEKPLLGIKNLMAKKMTESYTSIPHFSYFEELDATRLVQLRYSFKEKASKEGISITYMPFIMRALSLCLNKYPVMNSYFDDRKNALIMHQQHNIGIAITTKQGLIVPVLKNVQEMSLHEVIKAYEELKQRALTAKLLSGDMKDSTITISNFGVLSGGGMWATPIINCPEVAILGIARIHKRPTVKNGAVVVRDMLNLSWSFDHRVVDGDLAATFSHYLTTLLQNPAPLL